MIDITSSIKSRSDAVSPAEARLLQLHAQLDAQQQAQLLQFADFLAQTQTAKHQPSSLDDLQDESPELLPQTPVDIPIESDETLHAAIRRLAKTYPMIDEASLLDKVASVVMKHTLKGMDKSVSIEQVTTLFEAAYSDYVASYAR